MNEHLIAHYPLAGQCRDQSGHEQHGLNHGVAFTGDGARFDGRSAYIEVPHADGLALGREPFSICAWVHTERDASDPIGDLVSKYDSRSRTGVNLCLQTFHGVTSSQSNYRNLLFGIDSGEAEPQWQDCGRPGDAVLIFALSVFNGALYAGTFEMGTEGRGRVYRYEDHGTWTYCGTPHGSNAVSSLCVHEGHLYAAASHYRSQGSALGESENTVHGGHVYRYEGGEKWLDFGKLGESEAIGGMVTRGGRLYASSMYAPPALFRYVHGEGWENLGNPGGRVVSLTVHDGAILGSGYDLGYSGVYRYDNGDWSDWGTPPDTTQTYSFMQYEGRLYVGTWPAGKVYRYGGDRQWEDCGQLGDEKEVMPLVSYNGKLYAGTLPSAEVYRYEADGAWTNLGALDTTPDVKYRRAWSMAVHKGRLFCGTLPSGKVWSTEAGVCATHDTALPTGWRHVAAVREAGRLKLYVDGAVVAQSREFDADYDVSTDKPLMLGRGGHDFFTGRMADVRIYGAALEGATIQQIMESTRPQ